MDDESPAVRTRIAEALREFGPSVREDIRELGLDLNDEKTFILDEICPLDDSPEKSNAWLYWLHLDNEYDRLEAAFGLLADWQLGREYPVQLSQLLDDLAQEFLDSGYEVNYQELSHFLFTRKGLQGPVSDDYYDSLNSNLVYVIQSGHGLQISLTSIFMLVGKRLGLEIHGLNFPGHFMARAHVDNRDLVFDCYNGGRLLPETETAALYKATPLEMSTPTPAVTMIARVLSNLASAFDHEGDTLKTQFVLTLLSELQEAIRK